ncbi:MAG TPA: FkbM family methyltransferase [Candidatus Acidoferrum sp.]|nr:FkbM family methyltransferase [Candidatus Acidoferrum sp.]
MNPKNAYDTVIMTAKDPLSVLGILKRRRKLIEKATSFDEIFVRQEYLWLLQNIRPKTTVLDIGAKNGDTAIYFAMLPNVTRVISYEPALLNQHEFMENVTMSPLAPKIELHKEAIAEKEGIKKIDRSAYGCAYSYTQDSKSTGEYVKAITLDRALKGLKNVAIKCDCEGAELHIFKNANLSQVYAMEVECHGNIREMLKILTGRGFKLRTKRNPSPGSGMILAKRSR